MPKKINKYQRLRFTGATLFYLIITAVIITGICLLLIPSKQQKLYTKYNNAQANSLPKDHNLKQVNFKKLVKIIEKADADEKIYVYFGTEDCPGCLTNITEIVNTAIERKIKTVYYLRDDGSDSLQKKLQDKYGENVAQRTPELWVFKNKTLLMSSYEKRFCDSSRETLWTSYLRNYAFNQNK